MVLNSGKTSFRALAQHEYHGGFVAVWFVWMPDVIKCMMYVDEIVQSESGSPATRTVIVAVVVALVVVAVIVVVVLLVVFIRRRSRGLVMIAKCK